MTFKRSVAWLKSVVLLGAVLLGVGCASQPAAPSEGEAEAAEDGEARAEEAPPRPGAEGWRGGALSLPADSPIVTVIRTDALFRNARALRGWLSAAPAMYGPEGDQTVTRMQTLWQMVEMRMGVDPLSEQGPRRFGVDVTRPLFLGMYPAAAGGADAFVRTVRETLGENLDLKDDETLLDALRAMRNGTRQTPQGLNTSVLRAVESLQPRMGFRLVIPLQKPGDFLKRVGRLAKALEYDRFSGERAPDLEADAEPDPPELPVERGYYDLESQWPGFKVRVGATEATIDIIFREFRPRGMGLPSEEENMEEVEKLEASLEELIATYGAGRPAAPQPNGSPMLAVAADQAASARYARLQGYKKALEQLRNSAASRRDRALVVGLSRAETIARTWELAADRLSGVSYELVGKEAGQAGDHLFKLGMTLFGADEGPRPSTGTGGATLGVRDRGFAVSLALAPLVAPEWKEWLGLEEPSELVGHTEAADSLPTLYMLSAPRNLALFLVNIESMVRESLPEGIEPLYELREHLQHLEVATSGIDPKALRLNPKFVTLLSIDPAAPTDTRRKILDAVAHLTADLFSPAEPAEEKAEEGETSTDRSEEAEAETEDNAPAPPKLEAGKLQPMPLADEHFDQSIRYFADLSGDRPHILLSVGLDEQEAGRERQGIRTVGDRGVDIFFLRIEPVTLTSAITAFDPTVFRPLDLGILGQRIGPLVLSIRPTFKDEVRSVRYLLELRRPPKL